MLRPFSILYYLIETNNKSKMPVAAARSDEINLDLLAEMLGGQQ
jgi:hypothetical protein